MHPALCIHLPVAGQPRPRTNVYRLPGMFPGRRSFFGAGPGDVLHHQQPVRQLPVDTAGRSGGTAGGLPPRRHPADQMGPGRDRPGPHLVTGDFAAFRQLHRRRAVAWRPVVLSGTDERAAAVHPMAPPETPSPCISQMHHRLLELHHRADGGRLLQPCIADAPGLH